MSDHYAADVITSLERKRRAAQDRALEGKFAQGRSYRDKHLPVDLNDGVVMHGVTVNWLANVFGMNIQTVKQRLKECPPMHRRAGGFIYDLKVASQYLVKPVVDIEQYLKTMKIEELPPRLQTEYWGALQKRLKYEEDAGHLWRTEVVMSFVGEVFQLIRSSTRLWGSELENRTELNEEQREFLAGMIDDLMNSLVEKFMELPKKRAAKSILIEYLEEEAKEKADEKAALDAAKQMIADAEEDDDDFDIQSLV